MQKARSQARTTRRPHHPPTACMQMVSGSFSLPAQGCFSPFPHGTRSLSVTRESLALEGGPPSFTPDYSGRALLRNSTTSSSSPSCAQASSICIHSLDYNTVKQSTRDLQRLNSVVPLSGRFSDSLQ